MTKLQHILYQLLKEIHEICVKNGIAYMLYPWLVLFLQNGLDIPENYESRCVYMTASDLHRFVAVCGTSLPEHRSIESMRSNPMYPYLYSARYGNTQTLCMNVNEGSNYIYNGLFIRIEVLRSYPQSKIRKKLLTLLESGWRANTYQYTTYVSRKDLIAKAVVRGLLLLGRRNLSRWLYDSILKAYQCENPVNLVRWKDRNLILSKCFFEMEQLTFANGDTFNIPAGWEQYLKSVLAEIIHAF